MFPQIANYLVFNQDDLLAKTIYFFTVNLYRYRT